MYFGRTPKKRNLEGRKHRRRETSKEGNIEERKQRKKETSKKDFDFLPTTGRFCIDLSFSALLLFRSYCQQQSEKVSFMRTYAEYLTFNKESLNYRRSEIGERTIEVKHQPICLACVSRKARERRFERDFNNNLTSRR